MAVSMLRYISLFLLLATPLVAQDSLTLSGSVPNDRRLTQLYTIDFGPSTVSWTLACGLTTNSSNGLIVRLVDVDGYASSSQANPTSINEAIITGAGTANAALSGTYSGVREFAVEIEVAQGSGASDFSGNLTSNTGAITFITDDQLILTATGLRVTVNRFAFWAGTVPPSSTLPTGVELDFGSSTQTIFLRFECIGSGLDRIELLDVTDGTADALATFTDPSSGGVTAVPVTRSGQVFLRVNVRSLPGQSGSGEWILSAPSGITVKRVGTLNGDSNEDDDEGCAAQPGGGWSIAMLLLGLIAARALHPVVRRSARLERCRLP
jgi:hypothetical protein